MSFKRILILVAPLLLLSFVTPQEVFSQGIDKLSYMP